MEAPQILKFSTPEGTVQVCIEGISGKLEIVRSPVNQLSRETLIGIQEALMKRGLYPKADTRTDGTEIFGNAA